MAESRPLSVRLSDATHKDLDKVSKKLGITKSQFVVESIEWALENERADAVHVPIAVENARIKRSGSRVGMPGLGAQIPLRIGRARN